MGPHTRHSTVSFSHNQRHADNRRQSSRPNAFHASASGPSGPSHTPANTHNHLSAPKPLKVDSGRSCPPWTRRAAPAAFPVGGGGRWRWRWRRRWRRRWRWRRWRRQRRWLMRRRRCDLGVHTSPDAQEEDPPLLGLIPDPQGVPLERCSGQWVRRQWRVATVMWRTAGRCQGNTDLERIATAKMQGHS